MAQFDFVMKHGVKMTTICIPKAYANWNRHLLKDEMQDSIFTGTELAHIIRDQLMTEEDWEDD